LAHVWRTANGRLSLLNCLPLKGSCPLSPKYSVCLSMLQTSKPIRFFPPTSNVLSISSMAAAMEVSDSANVWASSLPNFSHTPRAMALGAVYTSESAQRFCSCDTRSTPFSTTAPESCPLLEMYSEKLSPSGLRQNRCSSTHWVSQAATSSYHRLSSVPWAGGPCSAVNSWIMMSTGTTGMSVSIA
jgi:hypothetical protein